VTDHGGRVVRGTRECYLSFDPAVVRPGPEVNT
jgi:hypothetical protein